MIDKNSIRFKIITPIFIFIAVIMLSLLYVVFSVSKKVSEGYHNFLIARHTAEIRKILDTAVTELTTSELLDNKIVTDAKKKAVVDDIAAYWSANNLPGFLIDKDGKVLSSTVDTSMKTMLQPFIHQKDFFHVEKGFSHMHGATLDFPLWNWKIITATKPETQFLSQRETVLLFPFMAIGTTLLLAGVWLILKINLHQPMEQIITDIKTEQEIKKTGISELDTVGTVINTSFKNLNKKTEQFQTLHNIATSLHENVSIEDILTIISDEARRLINAELSAVITYDEQGKIINLINKGTSIKTRESLPEGKGILKIVSLSPAPVRIENVSQHPEFSGAFPEGHPAVRNILACPIFSEEAKPVGALCLGNKSEGFSDDDENILKAFSADAAIALSKAERLKQLSRFKQVIDSAFDVIFITNGYGYITYVNQAFETLTGYSKEEVIGKRMDILKSDYLDDDFYENIWNTLSTHTIWKGESVNRKKDGSDYYASTVIFPLHAEKETHYAAIQRDTTHEKRLYEQLLRAQKMEAIGTLAGGIAHDFNNLLTAVLGYSEIIMSMSKEGDPYYRPASIINNAAMKGADLAKKILTISRKEKMEVKPVNINQIVHGSLELLRRSIPKNIEFITNMKEDLPMIKADPAQMQQVIMNLAVNARDAMPDGGKMVVETAIVGTENGAANGIAAEKNGFIKLSVSDSGVGIDRETQRKIFDPFFTTKETGKGTGLGLYIVYSVINNHGGYINLYSEPGKGSRFNIYLPATKDIDVAEVSGTEDLKGSGTVLIIDDDEDILELCRDLLETLGYSTILAGSGNEGINIFRKMKDGISAVILDMIMPRMGGSEVFQALKTIQPDVKVILCSGYSHQGFAGIENILKNGAKGFIQKPFTRQAIAKAIKRALSE